MLVSLCIQSRNQLLRRLACYRAGFHNLLCLIARQPNLKELGIHFEILVDSANQVNRTRLLAAKQPHSGAWLNVTALPTRVPSLGLHLGDAYIRVATAVRVGTLICEPNACRCSQRVDKLGHHGLSCRYCAGRLLRHANLNDVMKRVLVVAGILSWLEPSGLDREDDRRQDGVTVFPYHRGKSLCWDSLRWQFKRYLCRSFSTRSWFSCCCSRGVTSSSLLP